VRQRHKTIVLPVLANEVPQLESNNNIATHVPTPSGAQSTPPSKCDYSVAPLAQKALITLNSITQACETARVAHALYQGGSPAYLDYLLLLYSINVLFTKGYFPTPRLIKHTRQVEKIMNSDSPEEFNKATAKLTKQNQPSLIMLIGYASIKLLQSIQFAAADYTYTQFIHEVTYDLSPDTSKTLDKSYSLKKSLALAIHTACTTDILWYGANLGRAIFETMRDRDTLKSHQLSIHIVLRVMCVFFSFLRSLTSRYIMARLAHVTDNYIEAHKVVKSIRPTHTTNSQPSSWRYAQQVFSYVPLITSWMLLIYNFRQNDFIPLLNKTV
jgi:hypothetical protein